MTLYPPIIFSHSQLHLSLDSYEYVDKKMLKWYVYDLQRIMSIQNTISWNLWWKVET